MTIPGSAPFASAPYGAQPVVPVLGPEGGPFNVTAPLRQPVFPAAGRTATATSAVQTNSGYKGLAVYFNVTVNPGGGQTLALHITLLNPATGQTADVLSVPASAAPGGVFLIYPGLSGAAVDGVALTRNAYLPGSWFAVVTHSGVGSWTYTLDVELLP